MKKVVCLNKEGSVKRFITRTFFFGALLALGAQTAIAAPIKILSNSSHAAGNISSTITQLLGRAFTSDEFVIHMTSNDATWAGSSVSVALSTTTKYDLGGNPVTSLAPYDLYTSSFTGYPGDSVTEYNYSVTNDIANNYAYSASPVMPAGTPPATFFTAPGITSYPSGPGVEWRLDESVFCSSSLSCLTAANAGMMAVLRWLHSTSTTPWNWFDTKAALRQTGSNWVTGYNPATGQGASTNAYGFGQVNYTTALALTRSQIFLEAPGAQVSTSTGQALFTIYPFKQTRRVKEVLFQFPSAPATTTAELTLSQIQTLGGTKVGEYTSTSATSSLGPIYTTLTNKYFVWLTADNATDSLANFSRIDTYTILGPVSQSEIAFNATSTFATVSPTNNAISSTQSPTFTWSDAQSYLGIAKYQLYIDGMLNKDNITSTSTTPTGSISAGAHTWYVKTFNNGGTSTTTSSQTINVIPGYAAGYTFYVDNVLGSDNNPGTQAQPWATISKAAGLAAAGDTVVIIKNTNQPYRETLQPTNNGTASNPITFRGVDVNSKPEIWGSADVSSGWSVYGGGNPDTYQYATTTNVKVVAAGASMGTLSSKTKGVSATTLNPGEWYWASNVLYYRPAAGEVMGSIRIEASTRTYDIFSSNYTTYQDMVVRYANSQAVYLSGTGATAQRIEAYDSNGGFFLAGPTATIKNSIASRHKTYGVTISYSAGTQVYNSVFTDNTSGGMRINTIGNTTATIKNNVFSGNGVNSVSLGIVIAPSSIVSSNNIWDTAGDSTWNTYKGTNNQEIVDPLLVATSTGDFALKPLSPAIDSGTAISGITTDILGNHIYGTPDMGPYEYQPPYTIGINDIDITGNVRLYKDGKYRYMTATSTGTTATMTVTPVGGFPSGDYSEFLNIAISKWNRSGDFSKTWTESSSAATSTAHTIGNLKPNTYYSVNVDGVFYAGALSDSTGNATFTYSGGYSTHTFDMNEDTAPTTSTAGATSNISGGGAQVFSWSVSTAGTSGLAKYQLFVDGVLAQDNIATTSTQTTASGFSCGPHTWYVRAVSNAGNPTNGTTQSFDASCGGGPIFTGPVSALPGYVKPRLQTITSDGKVTYHDEPTPPAVSTPTPAPTPAPVFTRTLARGSRGADVRALQELLKRDPTIYPEGIVNGLFGPATERAVKRFQKKHGIASTGALAATGYGVVGPRTRKVIQTIVE